MPLYEYECKECGRRTEKIQKFSDPELTVCPHCSGRLERTLTAPAAHFKGGGWYKDLYSSPKPAASNNEGAKPGGEASKPAESAAGTGSTAPSSASSSDSSSSSSTTGSVSSASTPATASKS